MATSTTDTDTEISAVNSILGAIGQSPITNLNLAGNPNPEVSFIYNILTEINKDVQNEGWHFNTEYHVAVTPDPTTKQITVPAKTLRYTLNQGDINKNIDLVTRNGKLYDLTEHTNEFDGDIYLDIVSLYAFEDLPNVFQRYVTYRAAVRAASQLVNNPNLVQLLAQDEAKSRAACIEYECDMANPSYFGQGHDSYYRSYKPYHALRR